MVKRDAIVILACRNLKAVREAIVEIQKRPGATKGHLVPMLLDLSSLTSIREFVTEFKKRYNRLDILINNAGVYIPYAKHEVTQDGFEINFGVNHLGHFLLTNLLLDHLKKGAPSRVINVASTLHEKGEIRLDDLNLKNVRPEEEKKVKPYNNSKLANVFFSRELATRLAGSGVHTYALCPGWVKTGLARNADLKFYHYILAFPFALMFMRSAHQGCQTILHCALSKTCGTETGKLYRNCDLYVSSANLSENTGKKLWDISSRLTGLAN
jgi:NAD(P)-dependent dehydrogenase (short-subunit alcohol dehydrogenase family)